MIVKTRRPALEFDGNEASLRTAARWLPLTARSSGAVASTEICADHGSAGGDASGQSGYLICPCGPACVMSTCAAMLGTPVTSAQILGPSDAAAAVWPRTGVAHTCPQRV